MVSQIISALQYYSSYTYDYDLEMKELENPSLVLFVFLENSKYIEFYFIFFCYIPTYRKPLISLINLPC